MTIDLIDLHAVQSIIDFITRVQYKELIMKLAKTKQVITRKDVVELLHISGPQAYRLLKKLEEEGSLRCEGTTRNARYRIV